MDPAQPGIDWDGNPDDIKAALAQRFAGWHIIHTTTGWWATRSALIREDLTPGEDLHTDTAQELHDLLLEQPRRVTRVNGAGGGINV